MNTSQSPFDISLRPIAATPAALSKPLGLRTDIQLHIQSIWELINLLLSQLEIVQNDSQQSDDVACLNLREEVRRFEIELIRRALTRTRGSQVQAARFLGLNATTLNAKIKRYHIQFPHLIEGA
ncbi:MAG TPA: helix-turn-helix domain-containing protein [Pyrinomonadaceae bacterium]